MLLSPAAVAELPLKTWVARPWTQAQEQKTLAAVLGRPSVVPFLQASRILDLQVLVQKLGQQAFVVQTWAFDDQLQTSEVDSHCHLNSAQICPYSLVRKNYAKTHWTQVWVTSLPTVEGLTVKCFPEIVLEVVLVEGDEPSGCELEWTGVTPGASAGEELNLDRLVCTVEHFDSDRQTETYLHLWAACESYQAVDPQDQGTGSSGGSFGVPQAPSVAGDVVAAAASWNCQENHPDQVSPTEGCWTCAPFPYSADSPFAGNDDTEDGFCSHSSWGSGFPCG